MNDATKTLDAMKSADPAIKELMDLWQLINFSLGQNQALMVGLGAALQALPADSPLHSKVRENLAGWSKLMSADPQSLGLIDGFESTRRRLETYMGAEPQPSVHTAPPGALN